MTRLNCIAWLLLSICAAAAAPVSGQTKVKISVEKVTLFIDGAQVTRTRQVDLPAGNSTVVFTGLSPYLDDKSMQVSAKGPFTVTAVNRLFNHTDSLERSTRQKTLEETLEETQRQLDRLKASREVMDAESELLKTNCSVANRNVATPLAAIRELNEYYAARLETLKSKTLSLDAEEEKINERRRQILAELVNLGGTASGWVGETDARSLTATSKLGLIEPFMGEIYGNPQATQKMLDDAFFNVEAWINSELATEFAEQEEIAFTTGDGTKKPKGFLAYESTDETDKVRAFGKLQHIVSGEATTVTADAIIKLIYTLRKAHRTGAKFMMNNNSLFAIRLLKDTEGNYLWRPGLELGQPSSLAGYGIAENEQMPDIAADAKAIAFGNFKRGYTIVDRIGTRILRDPYTNKPFVGFYTTKRTGGMLVDSQAIKLLKIAAA